ncbi:hypothetical protein F0562_015812 [Nyssa sinensis]|uniref:Uncharacterized protein n=1 Tax=Nyssa sinensis TaxID=561372 RepID=A0A5J4ZIA5_9ASTE|nr:hypothetical protein F0562_015812 [Nyssa sinensis]
MGVKSCARKAKSHAIFPSGDEQKFVVDFVFKGYNSLSCPRKAKDWVGYDQLAHLGKVAQPVEFAAAEVVLEKQANSTHQTFLGEKAPQDHFEYQECHIVRAITRKASPLKRRPPSSTPKPPKKKAKARCGEVIVPKLDISKIKGTQETRGAKETGGTKETRAIPSGFSIQKVITSEPQEEIGDNVENLALDTRDEGLPPSSLIANPKNVPVREFEFSQTMDEDDDALRTLVPDVLRTLGLSDNIFEPSVTTDMNLVEELDATLEEDQELGEHFLTQVPILVRVVVFVF